MPDRRSQFSRGAAALPFQVQIPLTGGAPGLALPLGGAGSPFAFTVPLGAPAPASTPPPAAQTPAAGAAAGTPPASDAPYAPVVVAGDVPLYQPPEAEALLGERVLAAAEALAESEAPSSADFLGSLTEEPAGRAHSATRLFHALARPQRDDDQPLHRFYRDRFAILARPGEPCADIVPRPGDLLVRIAPGEGFGVIAAIAAPGLIPHHRLPALGLRGEGASHLAPGFYVHVAEPGPRPVGSAARFARRLADGRRFVLPDTLLLRLKLPADLAPEEVGDAFAEAIRTDAPFVRWVQAALNRLTAAGLAEDGQLGPATRAAVRAFQKAAGLTVDGIVGAQTEAALTAALGRAQDADPAAARCTGMAAREVIDRFAFNGSDVPPAARPLIANIAACITESRRGGDPIDRIRLVGHTDPVGSDAANDDLGLRRANAVAKALRDALHDLGVADADVTITAESRGKRDLLPGDPALSRRVEIFPPHAYTPAAAEIAFVLDDDDDKKVDEHAPVATFVRFGLWNHAYDAHGDVRNGQAETDHFIGAERRRFYIRVRDSAATTQRVDVTWKTLLADGTTDDDAPASQVITLTETRAGSHVYVSKAIMLVTDDTDAKQDTHSGLSPPLADARVRHRGESNHRLRRACMDGFVFAEYTPATGAAVNTKLPLFARKPDDERRRVKVRVIKFLFAPQDAHGPFPADDAFVTEQFARANRRWNQIGLSIDSQKTAEVNLPAGIVDPTDGRYQVEDVPGPHETALLNALIPLTPDNSSLTVVFLPIKGANAFTTIYDHAPPATKDPLGDRFFIIINPGLDPNDETLPHELHHALFNRGDANTDRQFYTLNTGRPTLLFGGTLPDPRIYRRIQDRNNPDPDSDPHNDNIINWARRVRTARVPAVGGLGPATATTGNTLLERF